jgi:hypothetical protein
MVGGSPGLLAEQIIFDIVSWNNNRIVYQNPELCYTTIYTIDIISRTVTGVEKFVNNAADPTFCKPPKNNADPITYNLEDGFKVYRDLKKQARPWLLRVFQSMFGN